MKINQNGVNYQITNWIDHQGIEFLGQSWGKEALRFNIELQVSTLSQHFLNQRINLYNFFLQEHDIYVITDAVVSDITEHDSKMKTAKGITLNSKTRVFHNSITG